MKLQVCLELVFLGYKQARLVTYVTSYLGCSSLSTNDLHQHSLVQHYSATLTNEYDIFEAGEQK